MNSLPLVVITGRQNVGKSTLFNALTRTRDALVADQPGLTRDRIYGRAEAAGHPLILVDTGGIVDAAGGIAARAQAQTRLVLAQADLVLFVLDARTGLVPGDRDLAAELRRLGRPIIGVVNKTDGMDADAALAEASSLGLPELVAIAAAHRRGIDRLGSLIAAQLPAPAADESARPVAGIRLALIGRPNVGKSTLLNRLVGEERALTDPEPGTTRDPVHADFGRDGNRYRLVDTAGIRRRRGRFDDIERLSTIKALQAIEQAEVVILLIDARDGVTEQDARLAGHVLDAGRALVLALNKWDGLGDEARSELLAQTARKLDFALFAPVVTLSALHGSGIGELLDAVGTVHAAASQELPTPALTRVLRSAVNDHAPPSGRRFTPKLRYAHAGGRFPTRIIVHGNRTRKLPQQYQRYLARRFREAFDLTGVPVRLMFRDTENPFSARPGRLKPREALRGKRGRRFDRRKK